VVAAIVKFVKIAALLATLLLAAACGGSETPAGTEAARTSGGISGRTLDGKTFSLADLRGKPVLINVWSSW
jgi:cytochrome oxidase Cu insertion factor (SCO1/SenC/PrrC family)